MNEAMRVQIVQEFSGRYLKITVETRTGDFGENILKYNDIDGILGAEIHQVDDTAQYIYDIGESISLAEFFGKGQFGAEDIKWLMNELVQLFERAGEYFLDEKDMILRDDCMFYDEKRKHLSVAYLDGYGCDVGKEISKILETCMDHMNHKDKELVFLVYGLHKISKEGNFCLSRLMELIGEKQTGGTAARMPEAMPQEKKPDMFCEKEKGSMAAQGNKKELVHVGKIVLYVAAGILAFVSVFYAGLLEEAGSGETDMMKMAAVVLLLIVLEGYLIGKARGGEKAGDHVEEPVFDDRTERLEETYSDMTVVLDEKKPYACYLNLIPEDWQRKEIQIRRSPFFIGKNKEKADGIISEGEVSRVHAKIVMEEDGIFVIDQESTNGTYINGRQLVPWERVRLKNDDKIGFSSIYYRVETGS